MKQGNNMDNTLFLGLLGFYLFINFFNSVSVAKLFHMDVFCHDIFDY